MAEYTHIGGRPVAYFAAAGPPDPGTRPRPRRPPPPPAREPSAPPAPETTAPAGSADAERVQFDPGATEEQVTGELAARGTDRYVLRVSEGQFMEVAITPEASAQLVVYGADGTVLRSGMGEGSFFRGTVPSTQDYYVQLAAGPEPARADRAAAAGRWHRRSWRELKGCG